MIDLDRQARGSCACIYLPRTRKGGPYWGVCGTCVAAEVREEVKLLRKLLNEARAEATQRSQDDYGRTRIELYRAVAERRGELLREALAHWMDRCPDDCKTAAKILEHLERDKAMSP